MLRDSFLKKPRELNSPFITNPYRFADTGEVGGWVELGRTTLGSAGDTITVSGLSNKRYYMVLTHGLWSSGNQWVNPRLGNGSVDTGTNYSWRHSDSGAVDATGTSSNFMGYIAPTGGAGGNRFAVNYLSNYSTKEKLSIATLSASSKEFGGYSEIIWGPSYSSHLANMQFTCVNRDGINRFTIVSANQSNASATPSLIKPLVRKHLKCRFPNSGIPIAFSIDNTSGVPKSTLLNRMSSGNFFV